MLTQYSYGSLRRKLQDEGYIVLMCQSGLTRRVMYLEVVVDRQYDVYDMLERIKKFVDEGEDVTFQPVNGNVRIKIESINH